MHIQEMMLDPATCLGTGVLAVGAVGFALHRVRRQFADRIAPLMGVVAACVFAAEMLNFPIPLGTSGHLLGGVLAAMLLGPWGAVLVLSVVLVVQCVLFLDGGITALGANVLNVAVIGPAVGYALADSVRRLVGGMAGTVAGSVVAAWFTAVLSAAACAVELAIGGRYPLGPTLGAMLLAHTMIGLGEALITGLALTFVLRTRPDLVYDRGRELGMLTKSGQVVVAGLAVALVLAVFLSPFASGLPDSLEWTVSRLGFDPAAAQPLLTAPMADYAVPGLKNVLIAGSAAGGVGTIVVFGLAYLLARGLQAKSSTDHASHAP